MRTTFHLLTAAAVFAAAPGTAGAAVTWHGTQSAFTAAAPGATDPTGMSQATSNADADARIIAGGSLWRPTAAESGYEIRLGDVTINASNPSQQYFTTTLNGGAPTSSVGIQGAAYVIGNPANENHSITIGNGGARAFGFSIYEPGAVAQCGNVGCVLSLFTVLARDLSGTEIGRTTVAFDTFGTTAFVGVTSDVAIGSIDVYEAFNQRVACCLYDNEYFGNYRMTAFNASAAGAIPEPATWATMIGGFALIGGSLRASRRVRALAA